MFHQTHGYFKEYTSFFVKHLDIRTDIQAREGGERTGAEKSLTLKFAASSTPLSIFHTQFFFKTEEHPL